MTDGELNETGIYRFALEDLIRGSDRGRVHNKAEFFIRAVLAEGDKRHTS